MHVKGFWGKHGPGWTVMQELVEEQAKDPAKPHGAWRYEVREWLNTGSNRSRLYDLLAQYLAKDYIGVSRTKPVNAKDDNNACKQLNRARGIIFEQLNPGQTPPGKRKQTKRKARDQIMCCKLTAASKRKKQDKCKDNGSSKNVRVIAMDAVSFVRENFLPCVCLLPS